MITFLQNHKNHYYDEDDDDSNGDTDIQRSTKMERDIGVLYQEFQGQKG